mgnify:CR=1 FL=1
MSATSEFAINCDCASEWRSAFRMLEFFELNFVFVAFINFLAPACSNCSAKKIAVSSHPNITPLQVANSPLIFRATRIAAAARVWASPH